MNPFVDKYFQWTRLRVTDRDIADFSPADPGYCDYVRLWTEIRRNGKIPGGIHFDLNEVIGSLRMPGRDPGGSYPRYRQFVQAVAITLLHRGYPSEFAIPNYQAVGILLDADRKDRKLLSLLRDLFSTTAQVLSGPRENSLGHEEEFPFFTFGEMILTDWRKDHNRVEELAIRLIAEDRLVRKEFSANDQFLLGLTYHNCCHDLWREMAASLGNPRKHLETGLVLDAILAK